MPIGVSVAAVDVDKRVADGTLVEILESRHSDPELSEVDVHRHSRSSSPGTTRPSCHYCTRGWPQCQHLRPAILAAGCHHPLGLRAATSLETGGADDLDFRPSAPGVSLTSGGVSRPTLPTRLPTLLVGTDDRDTPSGRLSLGDRVSRPATFAVPERDDTVLGVRDDLTVPPEGCLGERLEVVFEEDVPPVRAVLPGVELDLEPVGLPVDLLDPIARDAQSSLDRPGFCGRVDAACSARDDVCVVRQEVDESTDLLEVRIVAGTYDGDLRGRPRLTCIAVT